MVVVQSFLDSLCRCMPVCGGEMSFGDAASSGQQSQTRGAEVAPDSAAASANDGNNGGADAQKKPQAQALQLRDKACGVAASGAPCSMAAGLSTAESGGTAAGGSSSSAAARVAAKLRDSFECVTRGAAAETAAAATRGGGVPEAASSDVSSSSASSSPARRDNNSAESAEDREAKEALAEARKEAGRQSRRDRAASSSSRNRSKSRNGKRKADIFRSRHNTTRGGGSPGRARAGNAALADDEDHDEEGSGIVVDDEDDDTDDEIAELRGRVPATQAGCRPFHCSDGSSSSLPRRSSKASFGRMMLCFANPIHGSDSDDDQQYYYARSPCGPQDVDASPKGGRRGRKAARTSADGRSEASSSGNAERQAQAQVVRPSENKVRTIADDLKELKRMEKERERLERLEEALRNGEPMIGLSRDDDMTAATFETNANETITSTLYFDAKLGEIVDDEPRPPMPLFQHFKVEVNEEKDDEIRRLVRTGSHKSLSIMQMWKAQSHQPEDPPVLRATPTAQNVVGALGITDTPSRKSKKTAQSARDGPPRQVTPPERHSSSRLVTAPRAPVLDGGAGAAGGTRLDFTDEATGAPSYSQHPTAGERRSQQWRRERMDGDAHFSTGLTV